MLQDDIVLEGDDKTLPGLIVEGDDERCRREQLPAQQSTRGPALLCTVMYCNVLKCTVLYCNVL